MNSVTGSLDGKYMQNYQQKFIRYYLNKSPDREKERKSGKFANKVHSL